MYTSEGVRDQEFTQFAQLFSPSSFMAQFLPIIFSSSFFPIFNILVSFEYLRTIKQIPPTDYNSTRACVCFFLFCPTKRFFLSHNNLQIFRTTKGFTRILFVAKSGRGDDPLNRISLNIWLDCVRKRHEFSLIIWLIVSKIMIKGKEDN